MCMYVYIYICVYIYMYIYTYIFFKKSLRAHDHNAKTADMPRLGPLSPSAATMKRRHTPSLYSFSHAHYSLALRGVHGRVICAYS